MKVLEQLLTEKEIRDLFRKQHGEIQYEQLYGWRNVPQWGEPVKVIDRLDMPILAKLAAFRKSLPN